PARPSLGRIPKLANEKRPGHATGRLSLSGRVRRRGKCPLAFLVQLCEFQHSLTEALRIEREFALVFDNWLDSSCCENWFACPGCAVSRFWISPSADSGGTDEPCKRLHT